MHDQPLANYVTMHIGGPATTITKVTSEEELIEAINYANKNGLKPLVIGEGSNIIFGDSGFDGLVIVNKIIGLDINAKTGVVKVGAGEHWHSVVEQTVSNGLVGIESLALIPGTAGATPINNVGAYGQDISEVLQSVRAFDTNTKEFVELSNAECNFGYRTSMFKVEHYGRYIITEITLQLKPTDTSYAPSPYPSLEQELVKQSITHPTPTDVMNAVIKIRSNKLPDPTKLANTGSFFKNPIVSSAKVSALLAKYPDLPHYPQHDGREKLSAGWLVEQAGLKGHKERGMWVYDKQALVLVNESAKSFADLKNMVDIVSSTVQQKFGINLEPEPEVFE